MNLSIIFKLINKEPAKNKDKMKNGCKLYEK